MIDKLNNPEVKDFIQLHKYEESTKIALKAGKFPHLPIREIAGQIAARQKVSKKLPEWSSNYELILPPKENLEQASSQITAEYKSSILGEGHSFVDLTGGTGIDCYYISNRFKNSVYIEPNDGLAKIAEHNFQVLGANITAIQTTAEDFLSTNEEIFDVIYIDPSRRNEVQERIIKLDQYSPNILSMMETLQSKGKRIVIKVSPMIDLNILYQQLPQISKIHVVSVKDEVKEVLIEISGEASDKILAVDLDNAGNATKFTITKHIEKDLNIEYSSVKRYIYDANSSIRKAGGFRSVAESFKLAKLDIHTHLYTSNVLINDFPGRIFECLEELQPTKKIIKHLYPNNHVNVVVRNYPESANEIKKKFRLKDGGSEYIFFATLQNNKKRALRCKRL